MNEKQVNKIDRKVLEENFRSENKDCYIPKDFSVVYKEYARLPEYLRRYCVHKAKIKRLIDLMKLQVERENKKK